MTKVKISGYNYNNKEDNIFDLDLAFYAYTSTVPFYPNMTSRSFGITLDENNATTKGLALALDSNNKVCILITKKMLGLTQQLQLSRPLLLIQIRQITLKMAGRRPLKRIYQFISQLRRLQ